MKESPDAFNQWIQTLMDFSWELAPMMPIAQFRNPISQALDAWTGKGSWLNSALLPILDASQDNLPDLISRWKASIQSRLLDQVLPDHPDRHCAKPRL